MLEIERRWTAHWKDNEARSADWAAEALARFLALPAIYRTPELHARLEARARANLAGSLA